MNPQTNADLDKSVLNLMRIIGGLETGGESNPYSAVGDKHLVGGSHGKFQYRPDTWKERAGKYLGDPKAPMTQANQNKVTYLTIKDWKDKGLTPQEIDARWNGATLKNGKYVHNSKDREAKFVSAFNNVTSQVKPVAPVSNEPKYGFNQETESDQLARLQSQKANKDALAIHEQQGREGVVENVVGGTKDFVKGLGNSAERLGGNILTAGNEAIQKLGFKGSENPVLNYGTEANKFATGEGTAGTNFMEKAGGFTGDVLPYLAPQLAATKIVNSAKAISTLQKLSGAGSATRNLAKGGLLVAEGILGGMGTNIATEGSAGFDQNLSSLSNPLTQGTLNVGLGWTANILSKLAGKKGTVLDALNTAVKTGDEAQIKAVMQSPEMKKFQFDEGITNSKSMGLAVQKEVNNVKDVLRQHRYANSGDKFKIVDNIDTDEVKAFLALQEPAVNTITGKPNFINTLRTITNKQSEIGSQLDEVKNAISSIPSLKVNSPTAAKDIATIAQDILKDSKMLVEDKEIILEKMIKTLQAQTKDGVNFKTMDDLRIAGNAIEASDAYAAKSRQLLAQAVRKYTDNAIEELGRTGNLGLDEKNALKKFQELNKVWGDLEGAKNVAKLLSELPPQATNKLTTLLGATIATGGSYNPILFLGGAAVSNSMRNLANKINTLSKYKAPATRITTKAVKGADDVINQLKTLKLNKGTAPKQVKDPRSLRDILLNTPR